MVFRSVCNPIFVGLGTAAIFAAGAATPAFAEPSPSPSPALTKASPTATKAPSPKPTATSPKPTATAPKPKPPAQAPAPDPSASATAGPKPPVLYVSLSVPGGKVRSGDSVTAAVHVHATTAKARRTTLRLTAGGSPTPVVSKCTTACNLGEVTENAKVVYATVQIPKNIKSSSVTLTARVSAEGALTKTDGRTITVTKTIDKPSPSPTPTPTPTPGGTGSGGTTGGSGTTGGTGSGTAGGTTGYTPPSTYNDTTKPPQVALPGISTPAPSVAPGQAAGQPIQGPASTLRSNDSPAVQQLTFQRMASTQAAWLAALMVAFSLLLTQIRLGHRYGAARPGKGTHRRSRRGAFSR